MNMRQMKLTFNEVSRQLFVHHVYETETSLPLLVKPYLPSRLQQRLYTNYQWSAHEGYGPAN